MTWKSLHLRSSIFSITLKFSLMILHLYHFGFIESYLKIPQYIYIYIYIHDETSEIFQYKGLCFIDNIINISKYKMQNEKYMKYIYDILCSIFYNICYIYINIFYILYYTYNILYTYFYKTYL